MLKRLQFSIVKIASTFFCCASLAQLQLVEQTKDNALIYDRIPVTGQLDAEFYKKAVELLPIICVDVCVYDIKTEKYFLVYRKSKPADNIFCVPGGRMYKGETFFECAIRKCQEEAGLKVTPNKILDVYSLVFPDSAWNCPTHTIGVVVLAFCEEMPAALDKFHETYKWADIHANAENEYVEDIRKKARTEIAKSMAKDWDW